ncbi:hypothetical protein N9B73_02450, partial [Verrucomicrobiales bacterium]|nr:hypothetical protein [Verrucomicrobiales bacterium]
MIKFTKGRTFGWCLILIGAVICFMPWYSELFTMEQLDSTYLEDIEPVRNDSSETDVLFSWTESYTQLYVPPWVGMLGGCLTAIG